MAYLISSKSVKKTPARGHGLGFFKRERIRNRRGRFGAGDWVKRPTLITLSRELSLKLYNIAHSKCAVDKWTNSASGFAAFKGTHHSRSPATSALDRFCCRSPFLSGIAVPCIFQAEAIILRQSDADGSSDALELPRYKLNCCAHSTQRT